MGVLAVSAALLAAGSDPQRSSWIGINKLRSGSKVEMTKGCLRLEKKVRLRQAEAIDGNHRRSWFEGGVGGTRAGSGVLPGSFVGRVW